MPQITVGYFHAETEHAAAEIEALCRQRVTDAAGDAEPYEVTHDHNTYRLTGASWNQANRIFAGTCWLVRDDQFPRKLTPDGEEPLDFEDDEELGEPASFAYQPSTSRMAIEYNHNGPRHTAPRAMIQSFGLTEPLFVRPIETDDAIERLQNAEIIRKLEFGLDGREGIDAIRAGNSTTINSSLDAMADLEGYSIKVTISMKHQPGRLRDNRVRSAINRMLNMNQITTLKASAKQTEDHSPELLDLLGARKLDEIDVREINREVDHAACRGRLTRLLANYR